MQFEAEDLLGVRGSGPGAALPGSVLASTEGKAEAGTLDTGNRKDKQDQRKDKQEKCRICLQEKTVARAPYCVQCRKDLAACKEDADKSGRKDYFEEQTRTESGLRKLILTYQRECKSRGQGRKRDRMDWGRYQETLFKEKHVLTGTERRMMTYSAWETHYIAQGYSPADAAEKWDEADTQGADKNGPNGTERRFMEFFEYQRREEITGSRHESIAGTKDIRPTNGGHLKAIQMQDREIVSQMAAMHAGYPDLYSSPASFEFASGSSTPQPAGRGNDFPQFAVRDSGASLTLPTSPAPRGSGVSPPAPSTPGTDGGEPPKKKMKDVTRVRLGLYEKGKASLQQLELSSRDAISQAKDELNKVGMLDNHKCFTHYCDVLQTRVHGLQALIDATGESAVEGFARTHQDKLKDTPITMWDKVVCLITANSNLQGILGASTAEDAQQRYESLACAVNVLASMRSAVSASVRDLQSAVKQEAKKREREIMRQQQEEDKKRKAEALKAMGKAKGAGKGGMSLEGRAGSIFDWPESAWSTITTVTSQDFGNTRMLSPMLPLLVTGCTEMATLVDTDAEVKASIANFQHQAPTTALFKTQTRVACALAPHLGERVTDALVKPFLEHPTLGQHVREVPDTETALASYGHVFMYMNAPTMQKCATEERGVGQLRYVSSGARSIMACSLESLMHVLRARLALQMLDELCLTGLAALVEQNLNDPRLQEASWHRVEQPANSVLYVPTGWLLFEAALNCQTVLGLRRAMLVPNAPSWTIYEQLFRRGRPAEQALAVLDATSKLLHVLPRSDGNMCFLKGDHWMLKSAAEDDDCEYVSVVTEVTGNGHQATFTWVVDCSNTENLCWPDDKARLVRLILPGQEPGSQ
jgi:hypothetical protein